MMRLIRLLQPKHDSKQSPNPDKYYACIEAGRNDFLYYISSKSCANNSTVPGGPTKRIKCCVCDDSGKKICPYFEGSGS